MKESAFEQAWSRQAAKRGWYPVKIMQASVNGLPDRMYLKDGKVFFVEFKAANGKLSEIQKYRIKQLREMKFHVLILHAKK